MVTGRICWRWYVGDRARSVWRLPIVQCGRGSERRATRWNGAKRGVEGGRAGAKRGAAGGPAEANMAEVGGRAGAKKYGVGGHVTPSRW